MGVNSLYDMDFEKAIEIIYPKYLLMNTLSLLPDTIMLPVDISPLVQGAYDDLGVNVDKRLFEQYDKAKKEYETMIAKKESRADVFRIGCPDGGNHGDMVDWVSTKREDKNDKQAEATVRDIEDSLEVIILWRDSENRLRLFPWIEEREGIADYELHPGYMPDEQVARILASCTISLPLRGKQIDDAIEELDDGRFSEWWKSYWLNGELFLVLDKNKSCELAGHTIKYSWEIGLEMFCGRGVDE
jgi:hypothetical protein